MRNLTRKTDFKLVHFRKWQRKKYSVFNSLHRVIKICALILSYSVLTQPLIVTAQKDSNAITIKEVDMDEVVVTGSRTPDIYSEIARVVSVITKKEIEQAPANSIADILEYALNVDIRQRGLYGVQADINIRGGTFDQVIVLINGVNLSDPQTGHYTLNLPFDISSIERIEILNGPAARIYGANAFNGAINIITTSKTNTNVSATAMVGQYGYSKLVLNGQMKTGNLHNYASITKMESDGYEDNTEFDVWNIFYQAEYKLNRSSLSLQSGYSIKDFAANYLPEFPDENESTSPAFAIMQFKGGSKLKYNANIFWRNHKDHFRFVISNNEYNNYHKSDISGASLNTYYWSKFGKSSIGIDYRNEQLLSSSMGNEMDEPVPIKNTSDKYYTKHYNRNSMGLFAEQNIRIKKVAISAGFMYSYNSDYKNDFELFPGIDISYELTNKLKIFASLNKTLRLPTFTDLLYAAGTTFGNNHLKPEKSQVLELGAHHKTEIIDIKSSIFTRNGYDIIDWIRLEVDSLWKVNNNINTSSNTIWYSNNVAKLNTIGFEIYAKLDINKAVGNSFPVNNISIFYSYLNIDKPSTEYISKYALDNLKHNASLILDHRIYQNLTMKWKFTWHDREGTYTDVVTSEQVSYEPAFLVSSKLNYQGSYYSIFIDASNLLNIQYRELGNQLQPGIWINGGVSLTIDKGMFN